MKAKNKKKEAKKIVPKIEVRLSKLIEHWTKECLKIYLDTKRQSTYFDFDPDRRYLVKTVSQSFIEMMSCLGKLQNIAKNMEDHDND